MHVLYSFPDRLGSAGIGMTAYQEVKETVNAGACVSVYCTTLEKELHGLHRVVETLRIAGRRIPHRALGVARSYRYHDRRVASAVRNRRESIDVVHTWPRATIETAAASHAHGIPVVREVPNTHTAHAFEVVAREHRRLGLPVPSDNSHAFDASVLAMEEAEYAAVDKLLVPSQHVLDSFLARGMPRERLALQHYGFDPARFYADDGPRPGGPLTVIFVGRCEPRKGLHLALEAWIASNVAERGRFLICGSFVPGYREYLAPLLSHPSVEVLGFVSDPGEPMRASDVLIFPSVEEGSALVTYEARACGCVLLVSDATGARCVDGVDGLVHASGDVSALTQHLRLVDADRALLDRLRAASLAGIGEWTWSAAGQALVETYARLTGDRGR